MLTGKKLCFHYPTKHANNSAVVNVFQCLQYDCDY